MKIRFNINKLTGLITVLGLVGCSTNPLPTNIPRLFTQEINQEYVYCESCPKPTDLSLQVYKPLEPDSVEYDSAGGTSGDKIIVPLGLNNKLQSNDTPVNSLPENKLSRRRSSNNLKTIFKSNSGYKSKSHHKVHKKHLMHKTAKPSIKQCIQWR